CFPALGVHGDGAVVFPTCVGVFPGACWVCLLPLGLPHMRGGVSIGRALAAVQERSSPHAWGCFRRAAHLSLERNVFPTCVGVFLAATVSPSTRAGLPHMRGGVSRRNPASEQRD